ncbi:MAG: peptidylprolyl isomerase [Rudaea sp.]
MSTTKLKVSRLIPLHILLALSSLSWTAGAKAGEAPLPKGIVARQNGVEVTLQDVDAAADKIPEKDRPAFFDSPKRIESVVTGLLFAKQLAAIAKSEKLDKDPLVQREIAQASEDVLGRVLLARYQKNLKLPDFAALSKEYYDSHKDEFVEVGKIDVEHVLVSNKGRTDEAAQSRINEVAKEARAHPEKFDDLIEKYSDDPSKAKNQGLIANAASGKVAPPFAAAAKALKAPDEISPVVKTEFGYHVLKLVDRKPDRQHPFEEARRELVNKMKTSYIAAQMDQYTGEIRGKPLQANPDLVGSLRTRYAPAGFQTPEDLEESRQKAAAEKTAESQQTPAH